jgi:hypothetical protein
LLLKLIASAMTVNQPNPFKTPQPNELQSDQSRESTLQRLAEEQGGETDVVEVDQDSNSPDDAPTHSPDVVEEMDNLADRHPLTIDSPPG